MSENRTDPFESALEPPGAGRGASRTSPPEWERAVLEKIALAAVTEQRRARRWGIFFKSLFFIFLFALLYLLLPRSVPIGPHTAMVRIEGTVADGKPASAKNIIEALDAAFAASGTRGVLLRADSPGGSPVQAAYVYDEITRLKKQYPDIPVYAVVTDLCASACYYMISAADKIYANRASLVGSIGVLYEGFGFTGLLDKLGVQRRLITAGKNKGMLDPFSPLKADDVAHLKVMLAEVHQQFIDAVKKGRGKRLADDEELFTGMIWTGQKAMKLGLVDGLASPGAVARDVIGAEKITDYTPQENWLRQLADSVGASIGRNILPAQGPAPQLR